MIDETPINTALLARIATGEIPPPPEDDEWVCEQHPDKNAFHDDCPGPGMPSKGYYERIKNFTTLAQS